jgi:hypothetical protein
VRPIKTPVRPPQSNAHCQQFFETIRSECLDHLISDQRAVVQAGFVDYLVSCSIAAGIIYCGTSNACQRKNFFDSPYAPPL